MRIFIDNGHGIDTVGKCSPDGKLREAVFNREIARRIVLDLQDRGLDAVLLVPEIEDISLKERCRRVNIWCMEHGRENAILKRDKLPIDSRVKVAKETYREDVMMRCLRDSAKTVWKSLRQNPNITERIRIELDKKERDYSSSKPSTVFNYSPPSTPQKSEETGCLQAIFNWILLLGLIAAIIYAIASIFR